MAAPMFQRIVLINRVLQSCSRLFVRKVQPMAKRDVKLSKRFAIQCGYSPNIDSAGFAAVPILICVAAAKLDKDSKKASEKNDDELIYMLKHAKLAEHRQNYDDADRFYHKALAMLSIYAQNKTWSAEKLLEARIFIYDSLANLAMSQSQFEKAEGLYKETMRGLLQQGYSKEDDALVDISLKLAMIYAMLEKKSDAEQGYKYCIDTLQRKVDQAEGKADENTLALLGLVLDSYSRYLLVQSKLSEALENMNKALKIAIDIFGEDNPQVAVLYNDIATIESFQKDYDSARKSVLKSIEIAERTSSPDLPSFLCNLGAMDIHQSDLKRATEHCTKALKLSKTLKNKEARYMAEKCLSEIKRIKEKK